MKKSKSGFTLVELLVVIVVIGILAGITIVSYNGVQSRSRDARRKTDIANIAKAMEIYYGDNARYPTPTGNTNSSINNTWYSSSDSSWGLLKTALADVDIPTDPKNTPGNPLSGKNYSYAVFVNTANYCGAPAGQMYIIVWRYETMAKEKTSLGTCTDMPLGDGYYTNGNSYYRNSRV